MHPGKVPNGRIIAANRTVFLASDIVIFQCDDGFHTSLKCMENGEWNGRPPACSRKKISFNVLCSIVIAKSYFIVILFNICFYSCSY